MPERQKRGQRFGPAANRRLPQELSHDPLPLVAREDEMPIRLRLGMLAEMRKWAD
jgi:hypothetical protein